MLLVIKEMSSSDIILLFKVEVMKVYLLRKAIVESA